MIMYRFSSLIVVCLLLSVFGGCGGDKPADKAAETDVVQTESDADRCERKLAAALSRLQPDAMATQSRRDNVVNSLNSWLTTCAAESGGAMQLSPANAAMLSPTVQRFATAARFTENDTAYIRDCIILRGKTASVWKQTEAEAGEGIANDRQRIVRLFSDVVGSVAVMTADESRIPVGLYEILLTGRGTVEDRIWIFAEALRQRQIDAFLIRPNPGPGPDQSVPPAADGIAGTLIAVAVEPDVLLFDPVRGTPVPKAGDQSIVVSEPATLAEIRELPEWKNPSVSVIAQPASFGPRMLLLQEQLPAESSITLYEELAGGGSEIRPLIERVVAAGAGAWDATKIEIWNHAETRISASSALTEEQLQAYQLLVKPYAAPFERDPLKTTELLDDPGANPEEMTEDQKMERRMAALQERYTRIMQSSDELFGRPSHRFMKVRIEQMTGSNDIGIIQQLQQVRIATMQEYIEVNVPVGDNKESVVPIPLPEAIRAIHRSATGDALYWTARCQELRGDFGAAVTTYRNYRRQYPDDKFQFPSMINEGIALIQLGDPETARAVLTSAAVDQNPDRARTDWLLSRLPAAVEPAAEPKPPAQTLDATPDATPAATPDKSPATTPPPAAEQKER